MKHVNPIYRMVLTMATIAGTLACSDEPRVDIAPLASSEGLPLAVSLQSKATASSAPALDYSVYVFSRQQVTTTESYQLDTLISPIKADSKLKFSNHELNQRDYRFLFTATPSGQSEIEVVPSNSNATLSKGIAWSDIRLQPLTPLLSVDNYYEVVDLDGSKILTIDTIQGHLSRIVGQMIFQFSKTGDNINDVQPIDISAVTSIFDRIYAIEIKYENYTTLLSLDEEGRLQPAGSATAPLLQTVTPTLTNRLGVSLPQSSLDFVEGDLRQGGRILGYCLLPNPNRIKISLSFRYYDTTPIGAADKTPATDNYDKRLLELHLPQSTTPGLPVISNAYTLNRAGIRCNRIIDIGTTHGIQINTEWNIN